jgi:hypothetical protein
LRRAESGGVERRAQLAHARSADHEFMFTDLNLDQRHAWIRALREHCTARVGDHPASIVFEAGG